jgi:death on curing protein
VVTKFLTIEQVLIIHEDQVARYGGTSGLRDLTLLESALFRPQTTFGNEELYPTLFDKSAALMHSLVLNHPFLDANKRTAITSSIVFFEINGYRLYVSQDELVETTVQVATKQIDMEQLSAWFKKNTKKL